MIGSLSKAGTVHYFNILDLFAGSRSLYHATSDLPVRVFSVELQDLPGIDLRMDIRDLTPEMVPFRPDLVWASPPCTSYSIAGIKWHRRGIEPISDLARVSDSLVARVISLCLHWGCDYVIENPRGMLRKIPFMQDLPRRTVTYCSYGDRRMKPTDLWSNMFSGHDGRAPWIPREACTNGNPACHHDRQSRYYHIRKALGQNKLGTQGMAGAYDRSKVPADLLREVVAASARRLDLPGLRATALRPPYTVPLSP